jgi:hypothetical protein
MCVSLRSCSGLARRCGPRPLPSLGFAFPDRCLSGPADGDSRIQAGLRAGLAGLVAGFPVDGCGVLVRGDGLVELADLWRYPRSAAGGRSSYRNKCRSFLLELRPGANVTPVQQDQDQLRSLCPARPMYLAPQHASFGFVLTAQSISVW